MILWIAAMILQAVEMFTRDYDDDWRLRFCAFDFLLVYFSGKNPKNNSKNVKKPTNFP